MPQLKAVYEKKKKAVYGGENVFWLTLSGNLHTFYPQTGSKGRKIK